MSHLTSPLRVPQGTLVGKDPYLYLHATARLSAGLLMSALGSKAEDTGFSSTAIIVDVMTKSGMARGFGPWPTAHGQRLLRCLYTGAQLLDSEGRTPIEFQFALFQEPGRVGFATRDTHRRDTMGVHRTGNDSPRTNGHRQRATDAERPLEGPRLNLG